jgi:C4-dicarboxylate transporter DctM subunit
MPPSIGLVILGNVLQVNIGSLFMASVFPALLITALLCIAVFVKVKGDKNILVSKSYSWRERGKSILDAMPAFVIPLAILGGLYGGVCTPTEAAGVGCFVAIVLAKFYFKRFDWIIIKSSLTSTVKTSAAIYAIIFSSVVFGKVLSILGIPQGIASYVAALGLNLLAFKAVFFVLFLGLGMFLSGTVMILVCLPPLLGLITAFGLDPISFGVAFYVLVELGQSTPPVAITLFSAAAGAGVSTKDVIRHSPVYIAAWAVAALLLFFIPSLANIY